MNPHATPPISLTALIGSLWRHRQLIMTMTRREIIGRYKGSLMGLLWSFLQPLVMLIVYTFVFSVVFNARWGNTGNENRVQFALVLFAGLIVHNVFSEALNRAPNLILNQVNYVKKVVFPLEILPVVNLGTVLFHAAASLVVLLCGLFLQNALHWTVLLAPLVLLPLALLILGLTWLLAALGVYLRDIGQVIGVLTTILLFTSPVFFPMSALPETLRPWLLCNPLTFIIEQMRRVVIWGELPNWLGLFVYFVFACGVVWLGFVGFQKTRKGFADVL